jgi:alginate O-acetyltransferase complex protein AlgI
MLFNSYQFALFFAVTLALFRALPRNRARLWLLFLAGSVFYGSWSVPYLLLLYAAIVVDYAVGIALETHERHRRAILGISLALNLGALALFKYADFLLATFGWTGARLGFALPLGISFYTFLTLSYTIDVYRREVRAERDLLKYSVFVTFFPHLIAGPILRAREFLPQLAASPAAYRTFFGLNRIAIGLAKKVLLADTLAIVVEPVFAEPALYDGAATLIAVYAYAFQIYFDFSGYCDIAIGTAAMMGYALPVNFDSPYLAGSIASFWRRWHISLSRWLRDYVYLSLGGNRRGRGRTYVNLILTMALGGLWHGASWSFVFWGLLHGLFLVVHRLLRGGAPAEGEATAPRLSGHGLLVFYLVCLAWIFFRAPTLDLGFQMVGQIAAIPAQLAAGTTSAARVLLGLLLPVPLLAAYAAATRARRAWEELAPATPLQALGYGMALAAVVTVLAAFAAPGAEFIYFQF